MMAQKKVNIAGVPFYEEELKMLKRSTGETAATDKFIELLENAMYGEKKEMYTFSDFCIDREILSKEMAGDLRHLRVMWDIHGDDYIDYCKDNDLEFERLP